MYILVLFNIFLEVFLLFEKENRCVDEWVDDENWLHTEWENNERLEETEWTKKKGKKFK